MRAKGDEGADLIEGGAGLDYLDGDEGNDRLFGMGYKDRLNGGSGRDVAFGGPESDSIVLGQANDKGFGENSGEDTLEGLGGDDLIVGCGRADGSRGDLRTITSMGPKGMIGLWDVVVPTTYGVVFGVDEIDAFWGDGPDDVDRVVCDGSLDRVWAQPEDLLVRC